MAGTLAVFAICALYFAVFRHYGFQVEDEGTLLFQLSRVAAGQAPYVDFHTGYTPGFFWVGSRLLEAVDFNVNHLRLVLAVVNAASAAALYRLARETAGPWLALLAPLAWVTFIPAYRGDFAAFNVPYPAWFATLAWCGLALALARWARTGRAGALVVAGAFASAAFAVKPNAGAYAVAASVWIVALSARHDSRWDRLASGVASVAMALGVWLAFGFAWRTTDAAIHLAPALLLTGLAFALKARFAPAHAATAVSALVALLLGFAPLTLLWTAPLLARLGASGFLREILFVGSDAAVVYYVPHPAPEPYAMAVVAGMLTFAVLGRLVGRGTLRPLAALAILAAGAGAAVAAIVTTALMPERLADSVLLQLENAAYWLAPLVHCGGIAFLLRRAREGPSAAPQGFILVPLAVAMYWQLFPRTDFMHVVIAVPLTCVLGTFLLSRCLVWWRQGRWSSTGAGRTVIATAVTTAAAVVVCMKIVPLAAGASACWREPNAVVKLDRMRLCLEPQAADDLRTFGRAASYLARHIEPGEAVLPFPATAGLLFASQAASPVPHDYWYPGYPSHAEEEKMVATLERAPPRFVATLNSGWTFFIESPPYFTRARAFITERYRLVARFGRFDILARADQPAPAVTESFQPGSMEATIEPVLAYRRQAARRWMTGLEASESAALPADPSDAVLLLRGLRDGGDLRAAGWIVAGYLAEDRRVRADAVSSMEQVTKGLAAARHRWANDFDAGRLFPYVEPYRGSVPVLGRSEPSWARAFAEALLFVLDSGRPPVSSAAHPS